MWKARSYLYGSWKKVADIDRTAVKVHNIIMVQEIALID